MATIVEALRHAVQQLNAGCYADVERIGREVIEHDPRNADAWHVLGLAARKQDQHTTAIDCFRRALAKRPDKAIYHFELGVALRMDGDLEGAFASYQRALELDPQLHAAYVNAGAALDDLGRNAEALPWYDQALRLNPDCVSTHTNLGNSLQSLERFDESIANYRRAIELDPGNATAHWNFAMALLRRGEFREGWQEYDWRAAANETKLDLYPQPIWDGSSLAGKTLLVHAEQGIGDEILFASCYPDLIAQAGHCIFICEPRLAGLLRRSFPQATVIGYRRRHERTPYSVDRHVDYQIPAGSVPRLLRTDAASFPKQDSYLVADPARVQMWRKRLAALGPGLKVGISWRAGGKPSEQVRRTTDLTLWKSLFALPDVHFINLQYGEAAEDIARAQAWGYKIHDWDDANALTDLEGLAAMISALDLVIAVGNTTVHLAGALGAPAWSLVAANPSWRWMNDVERVPWYSSVLLFRQPRGSEWPIVFDRVQQDLCKLAGISTPAAIDENALVLPALRIPAQVSGMKFVAGLTQAIESALKLHQAGELRQAEVLYRQVLKNTPQHTDALHLLGVICQQTGRTREALKLLRQAIALCDDVPGFHFHLGLTLKESGQFEAAVESYRRAVELKPAFAEARLNLGAALQEQGRLDEAIHCYQSALEVAPEVEGIKQNLAVAMRCLGKRLQEQRRWDEAIICHQRALELKPSDFEAAANLGVLFEQQEQFALAADAYRQALDLECRHPATQLRLATVLRRLGRLSEALVTCDEILVKEPDHAAAHWSKAQILLQHGDWQRGWQEYAWRWRLPDQSERQLPGIPQWNGSSLADTSILIHGNAALADTLMFAACLETISSKARRTVLTCDARLKPLMARSFPAIDVRCLDEPTLPAYDVQTSLARLPMQLNFTPEDFHRRTPLIADPNLAAHGSTPCVGILWRSEHKSEVQPGTSRAPALEQWRSLLAIQNVQFISLVSDITNEERTSLATDLPARARAGDLDSLAAEISALDLVITVDDLVPHLAASLGVEVWLLLPFAWGWQWPLAQGMSSWYPNLQVFRPRRASAWPEMMARVHEQLTARLQSTAPIGIDGKHESAQPPHRALQPSQRNTHAQSF